MSKQIKDIDDALICVLNDGSATEEVYLKALTSAEWRKHGFKTVASRKAYIKEFEKDIEG